MNLNDDVDVFEKMQYECKQNEDFDQDHEMQ